MCLNRMSTTDFTCTERHGVEYLLMQMTSPTTQVLIGGVEPGLCRVASHLARKYHKLFLPWSCLEIPALEHNGSPPIHAHTQEEEEEEEERESAMTVGVRDEGSHVAMVTPTALKVAWAARAALTHLGWRHVCIITLAYLLVLPSSSPVLGRVLQEAEVEGVTRHSTFFILDPLYAPVPAFTPTHAHDHKTPRAHQAAQQPLHAHDGQDKKRFKGLKQLSDLSTEAARAVMVLAAATRGPPNMAAKGGVETNTDKNTPTDTHTNASPGHKTGGGGGGGEHKNKRRDREREGQRTEAEGRRRVVLPPAITALPLNQSVASESEAVLTRLVYDSVSLLSHLLRANVGTFRLRRKSNGAKNYTSEDLKPTGGQNGSVRAQRWKRMDGVRMVDRNHHRPAAVYDWLPSTRLARSDAISSLLIRDLKGDLYLAEDEAERERLYFEMKKLDTERQGRDFEKKLESIIGSRRIKENGFNRHKKTEGGLNKSQIIEMKLKKPTFFPALWGDGFVSTSGERRFDFLVLDWHPRTQELVTVLELKDNTVGYSEVSEKHLRQKEMSRGPYKILLTSSDLTLSSRPDTAARKMNVYTGGSSLLTCQPGSGGTGERPDLLRGSFSSTHRPIPHDSLLSTASHAANKDGEEAKAKYNGDFVHLRYFYVPTGNFEVKNRTMTLLKQMRDQRHENINGFQGMLCDPIRPGLVFDYCSRRSLEDIIRQEDIKLDWSFRLSLLTDLVRVTDYGLPGIYEYQNLTYPNKPIRDLLWKAPELLRDEALMIKGTQPGDVFSFAIIMQEVVVRGAPYCMILARLKKPPPMIRPSVSKGAAPPDAINIMKQCWAELPDMRPDFNQINDLFKKLNQGRRLNIVDTMFQMLEKYSSNLEELIRDRTEQLDLEKKKTEQLLNRMLPSISAYSTPFEVVDLLNDLYTAFDSTINHYNVYKIATMALDLLHLSGKFRIRHLHNIPLMLRIGIHTGPCCAGVVGMTMPRYCLFGDTVNTASRMESTGSAWRIHVSEKTWTVLRDVGGYHLEFRGLTKLKGKGEMNTYWLLGKEGFLKDLPVPPEIGLDEELVRLGRQHYMARRDSTVDSLASIKGFSSIHAAKMQNEALEASVCEEEVAGGSGDARMMLSVLQQLSSESEGVPTQDAEGEGSSSPRVVVPNGRTHLEASCIIVKEANKSCKDDSSSTKQVSKSNCVKSKSQSSVPKNICDSVVVVPKTYSRERRESHHRSRHSHARSRSPQPSAPLLQANHVDHTSEIELQMGSVIANTPVENSGNIGTHAFHGGDHRVFCKSNSGGKRCTAEEDTDDPSGRASNFPPGPRRESCRGSNTPRTASPPMLCHNKVFPQHDMSSPVRDRTTTWGHGPLPGAQQEMGGMRPTALQGVTAECQVHPHTQDPPSPTESTML
ncbi:Retinal guanylyl cyclase 2-like [Homarus americanus]|uniref:Guanylate cyclase n=1 Tax=Homarus americanus TaxID=6706 RepID=A0A8J5JRB5_HOMAM|nr:Retinal guanylyl cyclase 2-like [Homarus americanus]